MAMEFFPGKKLGKNYGALRQKFLIDVACTWKTGLNSLWTQKVSRRDGVDIFYIVEVELTFDGGLRGCGTLKNYKISQQTV